LLGCPTRLVVRLARYTLTLDKKFGNIDNLRTAPINTYLLPAQIQNRNLSDASGNLACAGDKSQGGDKSQKRGDTSRQPYPIPATPAPNRATDRQVARSVCNIAYCSFLRFRKARYGRGMTINFFIMQSRDDTSFIELEQM
jgi:hypothetical protein